MKKKKVSLLLSLFTAATLLMTGCGGESAPGSSTPTDSSAASASNDSQTAEFPATLTSITMLVNYKATEAPADDNALILKVEEYTGTDIDIMWVPQDAFAEKINTLMASKALPMVTVIREIKASGFVNAARAGMFWDIAPYIDRFENFSKIDKNVLRNVQTDGRQYLIPKIRDTARMGGIIRSDWLANLNMEMPETIDELHDILYAFTYNDPDQNGVDDTLGLSMNESELVKDLTLFSIFMGGCNKWQVNEDGSFTSEYETETFQTALKMFHDWYEEGLINKDFPINQDELTNFTSGKAGVMMLGNLEDATTRMNNLTEINPKATADIFQILTVEPGGEKHIFGFEGYTGCLAIPTTAVKTEEELLQVLAFLDKLGDPEMCDLFNWGIEGESYTVADGKATQTEEQQTAYAVKYNQLRQMTPFYTFSNLTAGNLTPLAEKQRKLMNENTQYTVFDPSLPFISETKVESAGELDQMMEDAITNYVIGEITFEQWLSTLENWKQRGGDKIAQEFAEQYAAAAE